MCLGLTGSPLRFRAGSGTLPTPSGAGPRVPRSGRDGARDTVVVCVVPGLQKEKMRAVGHDAPGAKMGWR